MKKILVILVVTIAMIITGCTNTEKRTDTNKNVSEVITGKATWYGKKFHGKKTASGEKFDMYAMSVAHKTLPFGKKIIVTNIKTNKSVEAYVNDRGPFIKGVVIDLSYAAFKKIANPDEGFINVKIEVLD
jgi:rare lipoprotein A